MPLTFAIANLHDLILEIGSWAGLAAVLGLGVLSALYFSQARDVKRLREWAGRAPERSAEQQVGGRPATQAAQAQAAQSARPAPAAGTPGAPAPAGGKPATPTPKPGTPTPATAAPATPAAASPNAGSKPAPTPTPTPPAVPATAAQTPAAAQQGARSPEAGGGGTATAAPPRPPVTQPPRSLPSTGGQTAVLSRPSGRAIDQEPWYRRIAWPEPRYIALIVAGVLVLGAGAAYGISQLSGSSSSTVSQGQPGAGAGAGGSSGAATKPAPVDPSKVTVAVLNGTRIPGLAAQVGDKVQSAGFQLGNVATATEAQRAESIVEFKNGSNREARAVARKLHISQIEPLDPSSGDQSLAGDAQVLVIVGADQQHHSRSTGTSGGSGSGTGGGAGTGSGTSGTGSTGTPGAGGTASPGTGGTATSP